MFKFLFVLLISCMIFQSQAQENEGLPNRGIRSRAATIIFAGLGGAVLGLSTLSFYDEPQNHINNITLGFGAGLVAGTAFVVYQSVEAGPREFRLMPFLEVEEDRNHKYFVRSPPHLWSWSF